MPILASAATNGVTGHVGRAVREPVAHGAAILELDFGGRGNDYIGAELCARRVLNSVSEIQKPQQQEAGQRDEGQRSSRRSAAAGTGWWRRLFQFLPGYLPGRVLASAQWPSIPVGIRLARSR